MRHPIRSLLYAADLCEDCETVLAYAVDMASRLGATLQVLSVIPEQREKSLIEADPYVPQAALDQYHDARALRVQQHIEAQLAAFYALRPDDTPAHPMARINVKEGDDVAQLILDEVHAHPIDMVLMGSHGEGVLMGLLFGSVVQEVTRKIRVPLLLVPVGHDVVAPAAAPETP